MCGNLDLGRLHEHEGRIWCHKVVAGWAENYGGLAIESDIGRSVYGRQRYGGAQKVYFYEV